MCGIVGKIYFNRNRQVDREILQKMTDALRHRGPDDEGLYLKGNVGLGFRRLSIIDLSPAGHQPMSNEDGSVWIIFNGEIYNYLALKPELQKRGHVFKSNTDTETVIHLYEEYGVECLKHLRGMFAFAIWDEKKEQLFLARDRVGKKPLKYFVGKDFLVFGSELKSFFLDPEVPKEIDYEAIHHYLTFQYVPHPRTGFTGIQKLKPGSFLTLSLKSQQPKIVCQRYWKLDFSKKLHLTSAEWQVEILKKLEESVKMRLISDVPLGAFLSGGVDSSAVVAFMARNSSKPVKTFSIGFKESKFNELKYAKKLVQMYGCDHTEFIVEPKALEILPKLVYHYEEPFADSSALPTYYVAKLTKKFVTVALNGDGGDENFAGYPWYKVHKFTQYYSLIPKFAQQAILYSTKLFHRIIRSNFSARALRFASGVGETSQTRYLRYLAYFHPDENKLLFRQNFLERINPNDLMGVLAKYFNEAKNFDPIDQALYVDINSYLPDDLLVKVDIATMANSLEARSPFLDHKFMEFTAKIPSRLKIQQGEKKYLLKKALVGIVPQENLYRQKMGFTVPISSWFKNEMNSYIKERLLSKNSFVSLLANIDYVEKLIFEHTHSQINNANKLWALLTLELWYQTFFKK
ncbi:asparagine synthase (glutamine-hydrolyzing) [Candidatus Parcubacteria bacterium]|jgi:asparagine synthase (glutamine-hydrolysing)|nr:MAG: asparagine synthase (glutamine-hydrolyzing) [Candidatus Parcubacteria bacterium]